MVFTRATVTHPKSQAAGGIRAAAMEIKMAVAEVGAAGSATTAVVGESRSRRASGGMRYTDGCSTHGVWERVGRIAAENRGRPYVSNDTRNRRMNWTGQRNTEGTGIQNPRGNR